MSQSSKELSERDYQQVLRASFCDTDKSLTTSGFVTSKVGNKITQTITTTTVANDTLLFSYFSDQTTLLYTLKIIFTDATQTTMISTERIA